LLCNYKEFDFEECLFDPLLGIRTLIAKISVFSLIGLCRCSWNI